MAQKQKPPKKIKSRKARTAAPQAKRRATPKPAGGARRPAAKSAKREVAAAPSRPVLPVGIHAGVAYLVYHHDPAPKPSLSASFLKKVYDSSPKHAWRTHPRLAVDWREGEPTREMDFGSAAHAHLLGGQELHIVNAPNWRTDQARTYRDRARAGGAAPVLKADYARIAAMKLALLKGLEETELAGVMEHKRGLNEVVAIWKEDGHFFRARADRWIPPMIMKPWPHGLIVDYKTTWESASAERWSGTVFNIGADFQSILYPHGFTLARIQTGEGSVEGQAPQLPAFRYIVQECEEPFEFQVFGPSEITRTHTEGKITDAFEKTKAAFAVETPPGYPRGTAFFDPPAWELKRAERASYAAMVARA